MSVRPSDDGSSQTSEKARPAKRARVAVACQRCKSRKQITQHKCNGLQPCSNCRDFSAVCEYVSSNPKSMMLHREQQSVRAVEERVAELESLLISGGMNPHAAGVFHKPHRRMSRLSSGDLSNGSERPSLTSPLPMEEGKRRASLSLPVDGEYNTKSAALDTVVEILRDLSLEASGGYIGASSQITMGRMISSIVQSRMAGSGRGEHGDHVKEEGGMNGEKEHLSPKSANTTTEGADEMGREIGHVPNEIADRLFEAYIIHISTRWPALHTPFIRRIHQIRGQINDVFLTTTLHLIYAIGGRFLETTGETGAFFPEQHYDQALKNLDEICRFHDIRTIQILLLFAIYSLRSPRGPGAWTYVGMAMRQCIEMGLHRRTQRKSRSALDQEIRKRVFWTCYCLDRQVSIILGRPFAISDRDIDVGLPLDIDEAVENAEIVAQAQQAAAAQSGDAPQTKSTSMTGFIYICKLRIIESDIQQTVYRVDQATPATKEEVEKFIQRLDAWKASMPTDARKANQPIEGVDRKLPALESMCVDGYDNYMVYYYKCMRWLLHPIILSSSLADTRFLRKCAEACGGVCLTYKKLHQIVPVGFSVMALHSVFLAGLTLLYCTWASPKDVFSISTSNYMNACSIVLYIITERWMGAKKYRDIFETIKQAVLDSIEDGAYEPRRAIKNLRPGLEAAFVNMDTADDGQGEFSAMVSDMAGGPTIVVRDQQRIQDGLPRVVENGGHAGGTSMQGMSSGADEQLLHQQPETPHQPTFNFMLPLDNMPLDSMPLDFHEPDVLSGMDMTLGNINSEDLDSGNEWYSREGFENYYHPG